MAATIPSTSLVPVQPVFTDSERLALAGFLAGYRGLTREAYTLDLRQFTGWCRSRSLPLFSVRRADIETFARELEAPGWPALPSPGGCAPSPGSTGTPSRKNSSTARPAAHVRRPRLDYESQATALDHNELGAILVAAGLGPAAEHALISLLALNGLRVSETTGADIEHLGLERGHRTLVITRKSGKVVTIPLAPHRPRHRPGNRRADRRAALRHRGGPEAGPARRRPDRPPGHPPRGDRPIPAGAAERAVAGLGAVRSFPQRSWWRRPAPGRGNGDDDDQRYQADEAKEESSVPSAASSVSRWRAVGVLRPRPLRPAA